jgi:hypothetical protein
VSKAFSMPENIAAVDILLLKFRMWSASLIHWQCRAVIFSKAKLTCIYQVYFLNVSLKCSQYPVPKKFARVGQEANRTKILEKFWVLPGSARNFRVRWSVKLLLILASTVILGFQSRRDPRPYLFFNTSACFEMRTPLQRE